MTSKKIKPRIISIILCILFLAGFLLIAAGCDNNEDTEDCGGDSCPVDIGTPVGGNTGGNGNGNGEQNNTEGNSGEPVVTEFTNKYNSFDKLLTASAIDGKPILLYISLRLESGSDCPYCAQLNVEWLAAKETYGNEVHFYYTQIDNPGTNTEARALYSRYRGNRDDPYPALGNAPSLVWLSSSGSVRARASGLSNCKTLLWENFERGKLAGWY